MARWRAARRALAWVAAALLVLAAARIVAGKSLGGWVSARERQRFERAVGPLDTRRMAAPALAAAANAVPAFRAAVAALAIDEPDHELLARVDDPALGPADLSRIDGVLAANRPALDALARAAAIPRSSFGARERLFQGGALDAVAWLRGAALAAADGERARLAGDGPRLARALATLHGLAATLRREPLAVFAVLGASVESRHLELLQRSLAAPRDERFLARAAEQLATLGALPGAFETAYGEAIFGFAMLRGLPPASRGAPASPRARLEAWLWPWSEGHVEAGGLRGWRQLAELARTPQSTWPSDAEIAAAPPSALRRWIDPTAPLDTVRASLLPNLLDMVRKLQLLASCEQLAAVAVALAARARAEGAYPATLAGIAPAARPDTATGAPPTYRALPGGAVEITLPAAAALAAAEVAGLRAAGGRGGGARAAARRARLLSWRLPSPAAPR